MYKKHLYDSLDLWNGAPWTDESLLDICGWHGRCYVWWKANTAFHGETLACGGSSLQMLRCIKTSTTFNHLLMGESCRITPGTELKGQSYSNTGSCSMTIIQNKPEILHQNGWRTRNLQQSPSSRACTSNSSLEGNKCHWAEVDLYGGLSQNSSTTLCETEQVVLLVFSLLLLNVVQPVTESKWDYFITHGSVVLYILPRKTNHLKINSAINISHFVVLHSGSLFAIPVFR